uniref:Uncharacterized protein n=1 Tax=Siphoviridae sp. ctWWc42 TaxID=2826361 RepID=A0A8S5R187_9CAUD|nr:MAG TPA: hypothetical protein [Siphoviridae sp. ctWWc42]
MFNNAAISPADIAAVTRNSNNDGFGDGNGWWILIILFALFGWGGYGYGNGNGNGCGSQSAHDYTDAALQRGFDNQSVMNKLNGLENGICSLGYDQLAQMNGINTNIMQTGYGIQNAIQQDTVANMQQANAAQMLAMQNANALQSQLANCCCENRQAIAQVRYDMATDTCAVTTAMNQNTRDIIDNQNANYRALHDELVQSQLDAKDAKIAEQQLIINGLNLSQSQANQNQYLISQLRPSPVPAFNVPNPYASYGYGCYSGSCCNA